VPSDAVNTSPTALRDLARELRRFQESVQQASKQAHNALARAPWNDGQKQRFVARFNELDKTNRRFLEGEMAQMVKSLEELAQRIERAREVRF
jgi:hypothetical protein